MQWYELHAFLWNTKKRVLRILCKIILLNISVQQQKRLIPEKNQGSLMKEEVVLNGCGIWIDCW